MTSDPGLFPENHAELEAIPAFPEAPTQPAFSTATLEDLESVAAHMEAVYAETYPNDRGITREMFEGNLAFHEEMCKYLNQQLTDPSQTLFVAKQADRVVGTIGFGANPTNPTEAKIWGFYVDSSLHGQGVSHELWVKLMRGAEDAGFHTLVLDVAKDAKRATRFYLHKGFVITGDTDWDWPSWTEERPHNQYWLMEKQLR